MWPSVPKIVPEKNLGTAYSLIYWIQNMGMMTVPIFVGKILAKVDGVTDVTLLENAAINAEYIFIALGIVAISVSLLLFFSSKKNPHLNLDVPNKQ
jgi:sugar phosphate permease